MKKSILAALVILAVCTIGSAHAVLVNNGSGFIYDTDLDITWYDFNPGTCGTWDWTMAWAAGLNVGGVTGWRLPSTPGAAYGEYTTEGEMGHLWVELGGVEGTPLYNRGPFVNLVATFYLSTLYPPDENYAWGYNLTWGYQGASIRFPWAGCEAWAIAVHDGNILGILGDLVPSDCDVDGSDLAILIANTSLIDLTTFAQNFGESNCP